MSTRRKLKTKRHRKAKRRLLKKTRQRKIKNLMQMRLTMKIQHIKPKMKNQMAITKKRVKTMECQMAITKKRVRKKYQIQMKSVSTSLNSE